MAWALLLLALPAGAASGAAPGSQRCDGTAVTVVGASRPDHADLCEGVRAAQRFLSALGLDKPAEFTLEATRRLPDLVSRTAAGCFVQARNRAYVLTYDEFVKRRRWFGVPISRALYRAVASHESAHAISACHFSLAAPSIQAMEYIAYVTLFSTMPDTLRTRALATQPGSGFEDIDRVSSIVYLFDPERFGAQAYRHFVAQPDGRALMRRILTGEVLAE